MLIKRKHNFFLNLTGHNIVETSLWIISSVFGAVHFSVPVPELILVNDCFVDVNNICADIIIRVVQ